MSGIGPIQLSADVRDVGEHDRIAHEVGVLELFRLFDRIAALDLLLTEPPNALSPEYVLWRRFVDGYTKPFHDKHGDSAAGGAGDMLDLIEEGAFVATGRGRLQPVSKAAVFREFMALLDLDEEIVARDAEAALAFLVEQEMVEVAGDTITVPARFWSGEPAGAI